MGCRFGRYPVENLELFCGLVLGPFADRGAATDGGVLLLDFRSAAAGDERTEIRLEAPEGNEVGVSLYRAAWLAHEGISDVAGLG